jgi:hypothetical protein
MKPSLSPPNPKLESMREVVHLLKSPANAKRLFEALEEANTGKYIEMTVGHSRKTAVWLNCGIGIGLVACFR